MDPNHCMKSFRSQLVIGKNIVSLGVGIFDAGLFAGVVDNDVVRIRDFASDKLVHEFCSPKVTRKLLDAPDDIDNVGSMVFILFAMRIFLVALNDDEMSRSTRLELLWIALITFTSLEGVSRVTIGNVVRSVVAIMCLVAQKKVVKVRSCTTEFLEYFFGHVRSWQREFSIDDLMNYYTKLKRVFRNTMKHDLCTAGSKKGYMHGFAGYAAAINSLVAKCKARHGASSTNSSVTSTMPDSFDSGVAVDYFISVGPQLAEMLKHTQFSIRDEMENIIVHVFKCSKPSVFLRPLRSNSDFAGMIMHYMPASYQTCSLFIGHDELSRSLIFSPCNQDQECGDEEEAEEAQCDHLSSLETDQDVSTCLQMLQQTLSDNELDQILQDVAEQHVREGLPSLELVGEQLETLDPSVNTQQLRSMLICSNKARLAIIVLESWNPLTFCPKGERPTLTTRRRAFKLAGGVNTNLLIDLWQLVFNATWYLTLMGNCTGCCRFIRNPTTNGVLRPRHIWIVRSDIGLTFKRFTVQSIMSERNLDLCMEFISLVILRS